MATPENQRRGQTAPPARAGLRWDEVDPDAPRGDPGSAGGQANFGGTPEGGASMGGLAGSNAGDGAPDVAALNDAAGAGVYDQNGDKRDDEGPPYAGFSGGAVGGTPAEKRAEGGRTGGGLAPGDTGRDGTIGTDPGKTV